MRRAMGSKALKPVALFAIICSAIGAAFWQPGLAEDSMMDEGIREYTAGKYSDALGHLGGALNSEFNNAKLHYYMGNCYLKLNQKEAAVREFRIAYALEPTGTAGKYAKQVLESMDVDRGHPAQSDVFSKALADQKALSKAITDYALRDGTNLLAPQPYNRYTPGGNVFSPGVGQPQMQSNPFAPGARSTPYPGALPGSQPGGSPGQPNGHIYYPQ